MKNHRLLIILLIAVGVLTLGSWFYRFALMPTTPPKPTVVATIYPVYDLVRQIAGNEVIVELIVYPGTDPATHTLTPEDLEKIAKAQSIFAVGQGLDNWLDQSAPIVLFDQNLEPKPYYWLSLTNARSMVKTITAELTAKNPELAQIFAAREAAYDQNLEAMQKKYPDPVDVTSLDPFGGTIDKDTYLGLMEYNLKSLR